MKHCSRVGLLGFRLQGLRLRFRSEGSGPVLGLGIRLPKP